VLTGGDQPPNGQPAGGAWVAIGGGGWVERQKGTLVPGTAVQTAGVLLLVHGEDPVLIQPEVLLAHGAEVLLAGGVVRINKQMDGMCRIS
jgi:hypothetical protein